MATKDASELLPISTLSATDTITLASDEMGVHFTASGGAWTIATESGGSAEPLADGQSIEYQSSSLANCIFYCTRTGGNLIVTRMKRMQ